MANLAEFGMHTPKSRSSARGETPTVEAYDEFERAFNHFNDALFGAALPPVMLTFQRRNRSLGYFSRERFVRRTGERSDEIALNPEHFAAMAMRDILSTLVHEMVHQWQAHHGKPSRRTYHNREWAEKMEAIGLQPSHNGEAGGRRTGEQMDHFVIEGGPFDQAFAALCDTGFGVNWLDRLADLSRLEQPAEIDEDLAAELAALGIAKGDGETKKRAGTRVKYRCPQCGAQVWGKADLMILCGEDDGAAFELVEAEDDKS